MPIKTTAQAINEATAQLLAADPGTYVIGEGITDQKGAFGTTLGLKDKFPTRVFDMPISESCLTGVAIGSALNDMRPIMVHMRVDFLLYAADQIINNAAKWYAMFGGQQSVPLVIRAVIGRGWGQGMQHSQHLASMFAQIPGLTVVCPSNAYDAKGLLIAAARGKNPVLFFEHRWIHELKMEVPDEMYEKYIWHGANSNCDVIRNGADVNLVASGYMVHECMKAAEFLSQQGIEAAVWDQYKIGHTTLGEKDLAVTESPGVIGPKIMSPAFTACPPSPTRSKNYYPTVVDIAIGAASVAQKPFNPHQLQKYLDAKPHDIPNPDFRGPF